MTGDPSTEQGARLDRWLWAARLYKTRRLAAEAARSGHVEVNGVRARPARTVRPGDRLRLRRGPFELRLTVSALAVRRGSAELAATLYREDPDSIAERERRAAELRAAAHAGPLRHGSPSKRDRRLQRRLKERGGAD